MLCGALLSTIYFELITDSRTGPPMQESSYFASMYRDSQVKDSQQCRCMELLKDFKLLQERAIEIEKELISEKQKLEILLHKFIGGDSAAVNSLPVEKSSPDRKGEVNYPQAKLKSGNSKVRSLNRKVSDNTKLSVWSFTPEFLFRPSLIISNPKVSTERSKDVGAKTIINKAISQSCMYLKKKLKPKSCNLVHGSLSINLLEGLQIALILQLKKKSSAFVRMKGKFMLNDKMTIENTNIVKNQEEIHIITMISDLIPLSRLKKFLFMLGELRNKGRKHYVYFSIYANAKNLKTFRTCILESSKNFSNTVVKISHVAKKFDRAAARHHGISLLPDRNVLIFFADIDITFDNGFLQRCELYTEAYTSAYFPIVFSMYNPVFYPKNGSKTFVISKKRGFWRTTGLGNLCIYKSEYLNVGGFDTKITGWGSEDDDLYERYAHHFTYS